MKKINIVVLFFLIPLLGNAQAQIGYTISDIKSKFPDKIFTIGYTKNGKKYISTNMDYGIFAYYFNDSTELSDYCMQIPYDMKALNALVEIYNKNYVIISERYWKNYVEGGGIIHIKLIYDEKNKIDEFYYSR